MFKRENKLNKNKQFDNVFKTGRSSYSKIIGIKVSENDLEKNRFGALISTKVSKKAVIRNKIRRRIKMILKKENKLLKQKYDVVVIVLPEIINKDANEIENDIKNSFKKLNLYKK